jgi:predicted enzyme related to lactoylglutathione lyase
VGIGTLRCFVIDVEDLDVAVPFWSEVTGLPQITSLWPERFRYLGYQDETTWKHELILHRVPTSKRRDAGPVDAQRRLDPGANRAHIDIGVDDVDEAIARVEAIGGKLKYPPTIFPLPAPDAAVPPMLDWAVMQDPFGNEFCLVRELTGEERRALRAAADAGPADDAHWRSVARGARGAATGSGSGA